MPPTPKPSKQAAFLRHSKHSLSRKKHPPLSGITLFICSFCVVYFFSKPAYAYLDPGTGNVLIYMLVSLIGAAIYLCKDILYRLAGLLQPNRRQMPLQSDLTEIVLFSEGKTYWLTFKPLVEAFIKAACPFVYLTMDRKDPALTIEHPLMQSRYIGNGSAAFARASRCKGKIMLATTPNIGNPNYPMPRPKQIQCLAHVCHGVGDIALYHKGSLDSYDLVFMVGDFMLPSIRTVETLRRLPPKQCLSLGLPYLDELAKKISPKQKKSNPPVILIAPSWGEKSSLTLYGTNFVAQAALAGYQVILRPHPFSFLAENDLIKRICAELAVYPNVSIDRNVDASESFAQADLLISDKSCIRFDFAFLYEKPVISLDIPLRHPELYEIADLGEVWEDTVAERLGPVLKPDQFQDIVPAIEKALLLPSHSLQEFYQECVACHGYSGQAIADWTIRYCRGEKI